MTVQIKDQLIFNGKRHYIKENLLIPYLAGLDGKPKFFPFSSDCWRGYYCTWELIEDKLFLVDFVAGMSNSEDRTFWKAGKEILFPHQNRVFASWYTGEIQVPKVNSNDLDTASEELGQFKEVILEFKEGYIVGQKEVSNLEKEPHRDLVKQSFFRRIFMKKAR